MKTTLVIKAIFIASSLSLFSCDEQIKVNIPEHTSRPEIPDYRGRNMGDNEIYDNRSTTPKTNKTIAPAGTKEEPIRRAKIKI